MFARNLTAAARRRHIAALMAGTALTALALAPAAAQDATWRENPGSNHLNNNGNWDPAAPSGTGFFGASSQTNLTGIGAYGGWTFNADADDYIVENAGNISFSGSGIVVNGGSITIVNNDWETLTFTNATAGSATILNEYGVTGFWGSADAGTANIENGLILSFNDSASASGATIVNDWTVMFNGTSTAAVSSIDNRGSVQFADDSTASAAHIVTGDGGRVRFLNNASGGSGRFEVEAGGFFDISGLDTGGTTAGSIEGAGNFFLGGKTLTVGANDSSTTVSGDIRDGSGFGGGESGGRLVKEGLGTLTLTGANTYTGGTEIAGGTLAGNTAGLQGDIEFTVPSGQLHFNQSTDGTFSGSITGGSTRGYVVKRGAGEVVFDETNIDVSFIHASGGTLVVDGGTVAADTIHSGYFVDAGHPLEFASLHFTGGVEVTSNHGSVSSDDDDTGAEIRLSGAGTKWTVGRADAWTTFYVSGNGGSLLSVSEGAELEHFGNLSVTSADPATPGLVEVDGEGSLLSSTGPFVFGSRGSAHVSVSNGGRLETGGGAVGMTSLETGIVTIAGAGSVWQTLADEDERVEHDLILGGYDEDSVGAGHVTLADGGLLRLGTGGDGTIFAANGEDSIATVNIGAAQGEAAAGAGTLEAAEIDFGAADGGDGRLVFNHTALEHIFAPVVSGFGTIMQLAGITRLTGYSEDFEGDTHVTGGTLVVGNALGGTIHVSGGGRLGGTGNIGNVAVGNGGILAPGNSVGAIIAYGDVAFGDGAVYEVEVNDGTGHAFIDRPGVNNDYVDVRGALAIDSGASVSVTPENGTDDGSTYTPGLLYTILSATDGVTGAFGAVTASFAFLTPELSYDANNVFLELVYSNVDFGDVAETPNQKGVANALQSFGPGHPIYDEIILMSEEQARAVYDALTGEAHASSSTSQYMTAGEIRQQLLNRIAAILGLGGGGFAGLAGAPAAGDAAPGAASVWGQLFGGWGKTDDTGIAASIDRDVYGFFGGIDREVAPGVRAGIAAGYSRSTYNVAARSSSGDSDNFHLAGYAGTRVGAFDVKGVASYGYGKVNARRTVIVGGLTNDLAADYATHTFQAGIEAGFDLDLGPLVLTPFAGLAGIHVETGGFTETGGPAALTFGSTSSTTGVSTLGLRARRQAGGVGMSGSLAWRHAFGDVAPASRAAFASAPAATFAVRGTPIAENALALDAAIDARLGADTTLTFGYAGELASGARDHGLRAELRVEF